MQCGPTAGYRRPTDRVLPLGKHLPRGQVGRDGERDAQDGRRERSTMAAKILIVTGDAAESLEVLYPYQRLREEGYEVHIAEIGRASCRERVL